MQLEIVLNIEQNMSRPSPGHQQQAARTLQTTLIEYTQTSKFLCDHFVTISKIIQIVLLLSCCYFWIFVTLWTVVLHAPLFTEFSGQDYCNGLQFPAPGDVPNPGTGTVSPALGGWTLPQGHLRSPRQILQNKEREKKEKEFAIFIFYFFLNWQH